MLGRFTLWRRWMTLPTGQRRAAALALATLVAATALVYQTNVRSERPPVFSRGGPFAGQDMETPGAGRGNVTSPAATDPSVDDRRSEAVVRAPAIPDTTARPTSDAFVTPALGTYVYDVDGYEEATAFGRRSYPEEMHMTVHHSQPSDEDVPKLEPDELIFDLDFSSEHEEREIVAFDETGVSFTYEAGSVTFGPVTRTSEATYEPPMLQVPLPLALGTRRSGTSEATTPDGEHARTEDWAVEVGGREVLPVFGEQRETWVVRIERSSRPGSSEQVERSRTYWVDTDLGIWVRWTEELDGSQALGPGTFRYRTEFTATLDRIEPL